MRKEYKSPHLKQPEQGRVLPLWQTADSWWVLQIHGPSAVPDYDDAFFRRSMTDNDYRREVGLDWHATSGKRVYPEFGRELHVAKEPLEFDPDLPLHCGWDMPGTPAFAVTQVNAWGQWCLLSSLSPKEGISIGVYDFAQMAADHLYTKYAQPYGLELEELQLVHVGDPAGWRPMPRAGESPQEARSCFEIVKRGVKVYLGKDEDGEAVYEERPGWGWDVIPGAVGITDRLEAVRARLRRLTADGLPALIVNPEPDGKIFIEAFLGGYAYKARADGRYEHDPEKNFYSHSMDAASYVCTRLDALPPRKDDDWTPKREPWRSQASRNR